LGETGISTEKNKPAPKKRGTLRMVRADLRCQSAGNKSGISGKVIGASAGKVRVNGERKENSRGGKQ